MKEQLDRTSTRRVVAAMAPPDPVELRDINVECPRWFLDVMSIPREEGFVDVEGCPIHYFRWGNPESPGIIMVHGRLAHARCLAFIAALLSADYHVVSMDVSGMGDSGCRDDYSQEMRARELVGVAQGTGLCDDGRKPTIVAHSFGGGYSMTAVELYPDVFSAIVVCDMMMLRPEDVAGHEARHDRLSNKKHTSGANRVYPDLEAAMARFRLAPPQPCENEYLVRYIGRHSLKEVEDGWTWKFDYNILGAEVTPSDWWLELPKRFTGLEIPHAIIYAEHSILFKKHTADYIQELAESPIPMIEIPDAHHHIMLDQPHAFAEAIHELVAR